MNLSYLVVHHELSDEARAARPLRRRRRGVLNPPAPTSADHHRARSPMFVARGRTRLHHDHRDHRDHRGVGARVRSTHAGSALRQWGGAM